MLLPTLNEITLQDIQFLIDNEVIENKHLEYKQEFSNKASSKTKFLAEICAFANSSGGDLLYGIKEDNGIPVAIIGIEANNIDSEIQRINNVLRTGIEPRLPSYDIKHIEVSNNKYILVIRVRKSWNSPHRVTQNKEFYGRNSSGKYPLDVGEIRNKILLSDSLSEKIKKFKTDRIIKISSNETKQPMDEGPKLVMHIIPVPSFSNDGTISISKHRRILEKFWPISSTGMNYRINIDGNICYTGGLGEKTKSYTQVYRSGIVEACLSLKDNWSDKKSIYMPRIEVELINKTYSYLDLLSKLDITFPIIVYISFVGIEGYTLDFDRHGADVNHPSKEDIILLPEIFIDNYSSNIEQLYKPAYDVLYNAFGFSQSFSYDANGKIIKG